MCARSMKFAHQQQSGVATLFVAVMLVLLAMLGIYTLNRGVIAEIRLVGDLNRAQQALQAAESRLTCGISQFLDTSAGSFKSFADIETACISAPNTLKICHYDSAQPPSDINSFSCTTPSGTMLMLATGYSTDGTAKRTVSMVLSGKQTGLRSGNLAPLTVKGATGTITGGATVINNDANVTIWTGEPIGAISGSFTTKININGTETVSTSNAGGGDFNLGPDVVFADANLANLSPENFQRLSLLSTFDEFKSKADKVFDMSADPSLTLAAIESALDNPANTWQKIAVVLANTNDEIKIQKALGTSTKPVALAIGKGNVEFSAAKTHYGLIFSNGIVDFSGGGTLNGAVAADGIIGGGSGNFTIRADANVTDQVVELLDPSRAVVANTWRDW